MTENEEETDQIIFLPSHNNRLQILIRWIEREIETKVLKWDGRYF